MIANSLSILDVGPVIFGDPGGIVTYLQGKQLLATNKTCTCGTAMNLGKKSDISDGLIFRCPSCKTTKSLRDSSFFSKSKLTLQKWLVLIYWWVRQYPVTDAAQEVCSTKLIATTIKLEGPGKIVQIDESLFHHKPKVKQK